MRYTERKTITQEFMPTAAEFALYEQISEFLRKESSYALPKRHKHLTALILRKLLASSPQAVLGTLKAILLRLQNLQQLEQNQDEPLSEIEALFDGEELTTEDVEADELDAEEIAVSVSDELNQAALQAEITEIEGFIRLAEGLQQDSKILALLTALQTGFAEMAKLGANQKAIIFTESVRTQKYLFDFLTQNGYADNVVLFSGTNNDPNSVEIYQDWLVRHQGTEKITGSAEVDKRSALIEHFKEKAQIMIATEAASEGVNLQFCSLLINYDLPWNPQRVEQRIGRCHRYGQKFDVVVINFLNKRNLADQRVLELLTEKFKLFQGVLGASDEVLGRIESGVDIENQIANIYATCRTENEIQTAFDQLQAQFADEIEGRVQETKNALVSSFDQSVLERLKVMTEDRLNAMEQWFWGVTQFALNGKAQFNQTDWYFLLENSPLGGIPLGRYLLPRKERTTTLQGYEYRLNQPLGQWCINEALNADTPNATLVFDYTNFSEKISLIEQSQGKSGWLRLNKISVESNAESQESLVFIVCDEQGNLLDKEFAQKLFLLSADLQNSVQNPPLGFEKLVREQIDSEKARIKAENDALLKAESVRINAWAKDQMQAAEELISELKEAMRGKEKELVLADDIELQIQLQEEITKLRKQLRKARNELDDVQDEIAEQELRLLKELKGKIHQTMQESVVFQIFWMIQ